MEMPKELYVYSEEGKNDKFSYGVRRVGDVTYVLKSEYDLLLARCERYRRALEYYSPIISDGDGGERAREALRES